MKTVEEFIKENEHANERDRVALCEEYTEAYYQKNGRHLNSNQLIMLADFLLADKLKDVSRSKVQREEYPILSKPQINRRGREMSMEQDIVDVIKVKRGNNLPTTRKVKKQNDA